MWLNGITCNSLCRRNLVWVIVYIWSIIVIICPFHCFSETEFRSFLMAYTYVGSTFGALFVSILNTLMPWRMVAFACIFVPILTLIILLFVSNSKKFRLFYEFCGLPQAFFHSSGSRITIMVAIKKSITSSWWFALLATRLGSKRSHIRWIPSTSTLQRSFKIVWFLHQTESHVFSSTDKRRRKIPRIQTKTNTEAIVYHSDTCLHAPDISSHHHQAVYSANFQSIWEPDTSRSSSGCA